MLSWPGTVNPGVSDKLICQVDMVATFSALLTVQLPADAAPDSENHLDAWLKRGGRGRDVLILQNVNNNLSIEDGTWKYIAPGTGASYNIQTNTELGNLNQDQLYDLSKDIGERVNVATNHPDIIEKLKIRLDKIKLRESKF